MKGVYDYRKALCIIQQRMKDYKRICQKGMMYSLLGAILLSMGGCSTQKEPADTNKDINQTLIQYSLDQTMSMDRFAEDETLVSMYINNSDVNEIAKEIATIDTSKPLEAIIYDLDYEIIESFYGSDIKFSEEQKELLVQKINPSYLLTMVSSREGSTFLATVGILSISKSYAMPSDWDNMKIVKLVYDGEYCSATAFYSSGDQIISAISYFCPSDGWSEYEELFGLTPMTIAID